MEGVKLDYFGVAVQIAVALGFVVVSMIATHVLGPKRGTDKKLETAESGIKVVGNARVPFNIKYFLVAILFVIFDIEVIFMYPWAVNFKELGMLGLIEMFIFMGGLMLGFFYIIKKGALEMEK